MNVAGSKVAGAEKFGVNINIDITLDRKPGVSSFPKKLDAAKKNLSKIKRK
jgi:hypothetical protein